MKLKEEKVTGARRRPAKDGAASSTSRANAKSARMRHEKQSAGFRDGIMRDMCRLYEETLGRAVGPSDDFFAIGGHSVLALCLVNRIRRTFGCELPIREVFRHPTIEAMTNVIVTQIDAKRLRQAAALVRDYENETEEGAL